MNQRFESSRYTILSIQNTNLKIHS